MNSQNLLSSNMEVMFPEIGVPQILENSEKTLSGYIVASPNGMAQLRSCFYSLENYRIGKVIVYEWRHPLFVEVVIDHIRQCPLRGPEDLGGNITFRLEASFTRGGLLTSEHLTFYLNDEITTEVHPVTDNFLFFSMPAGSSVKMTGNVLYNSSFDHSIFRMGYLKYRPLMKDEEIPEVDTSNLFEKKLSEKSLRYDNSNDSVTISPKLDETTTVFDIFHERRGNETEKYRYFIETDGSYTAYEANAAMLKLYASRSINGDKHDFRLFKRE